MPAGKRQEQRHCRCSGVLIIDLGQISAPSVSVSIADVEHVFAYWD